MEEFKVLITTSGIGSRLGELTDFTNKCLIRVSDKPAISYIIESYPRDTNFVVTLGHFGSHVKQFLNLAYPDRKFEFVLVDKYKGEGSSLGYSIYKCKDILKCPFIFHASDTIIINEKIPSPSSNYVMGAYKNHNSQYRTLNINNGSLGKINEKGEMGHCLSYIGIAGIKNYRLFFHNLQLLLKDTNKEVSDADLINKMIKTETFYAKEIKNESWFDIGNTSELNITRNFFKSSYNILDKKDESIFFFDDFVIKFFSDEKINYNRVKRAEILSDLVPEIINSTENFYKYRKIDGSLLSESVNVNKFKSFLDWTKKNLWKKQNIDIKNKCYNFYIEKTKKRVSKFLDNNIDTETTINGQKILPIEKLLQLIDIDWLTNGIASRIHGDFILDNVLEKKKNKFFLIDWRQDFDGDLEIGDIYYDLAKLNHNLTVNHEIVKKELFSHKIDDCYILINSKLNDCKESLKDFIIDNNYDIKKVETLTSLIWINMAPLHEYPFNKFLFNFGKYNLQKTIMEK